VDSYVADPDAGEMGRPHPHRCPVMSTLVPSRRPAIRCRGRRRSSASPRRRGQRPAVEARTPASYRNASPRAISPGSDAAWVLDGCSPETPTNAIKRTGSQ
jgi:hypothetical protein